MKWQDVVFSTGSLIFVLALLPALFVQERPPTVTSLSTGLVLAAFSATYVTLGLYMSAAVTSVTATIWLLLAAGVVL